MANQLLTDGKFKLSNNDFDGARADLRRALSYNLDLAEAQKVLASIDSREKAYKEQKAKELLASGKLKLNNNDFDGARADLRQALSYNPDLIEAQEVLASINAKQIAYMEQKQRHEMQNYMASCKQYEYRVLKKDADLLKGHRILVKGKIAQIVVDRGTTFMRVEVSYKGYGIWDDVVGVFYDGNVNLYDGDFVTAWGEVIDNYTYTSQAGWRITIPAVKAKYVVGGLR